MDVILVDNIPEEYLPHDDMFVPFTLNNTAYGSIGLRPTNKNIDVNFISNTSTSGRIYFELIYFI